MPESPDYIGRFAPSPTGELHMGSLVAAVVSFLDARSHAGRWHLRIENLDPPREVDGSAASICRALETLGFQWDGNIVFQSDRDAAYQQAFEYLKQRDLVYPCICSRKEIAAVAADGIEGPVYPGTCRAGLPRQRPRQAWRMRTDNAPIRIMDRWQGEQLQRLERDIGDFVILRADGYWAYQLAVVVDDAELGVTDVVRGTDLLLSTPRQAWIYQQLDWPVPRYAHHPLLLTAAGDKYAKQGGSPGIDLQAPGRALHQALDLLGQQPPAELAGAPVEEIWAWALPAWNPASFTHEAALGPL
ncbi:MAG: tRNA glutamyl-Q(34) synthetase GluQRS [Gammaproteobacteria bacterium]|nr:tRNA glutamyl-Q(34) synthetase GluQRS [Gammaproteobacteria bacterium]